MRKQFLFIFLALIVASTSQAQTRTTRIGYIDMEYILENVSDYKEAKAQLELKAQKWKQEIEAKKLDIDKLKESLKAEKALLTKELIDEREGEIKFLETEMMDYQQKQFGADGNLIRHKAALAKPIQDQVFTAVQDIAEAKNYDFVFDKSSDLTMLFSNKRFDISDQVLRILNRTEKREQLTKKQLKEQEVKENRENEIDENPAMADRQKVLDERKAAREKLIEDRRLEQEAKKKEYDDRRKAILAEREAKKKMARFLNQLKQQVLRQLKQQTQKLTLQLNLLQQQSLQLQRLPLLLMMQQRPQQLRQKKDRRFMNNAKKS